MIANTIIKAALRKLLVVPSGGTPSTTQYADGLEVLNDLISSWSANFNLTYENSFEELTIPAGTQSITIGATGTLVTARPIDVINASLKEGNIEYMLDIIRDKAYQREWDKTETERPERLYYRKTYPNGTIYFESTTDEEYTLILTSMKQLTSFPDGTTAIDLPEFYERALKTNLTIELADEFGAGNRVTQAMIKLADESKTAIIGASLSINASVTELSSYANYERNTDR